METHQASHDIPAAAQAATSPDQLLRGLYASIAGRDPSPLSRWVADDVIVEIPGRSPNAGRHVGVAALVAVLSGARARTGGTLELRVDDITVGRDLAIAVATYTATRPGRAPLENHLCHLVRCAGGRIVYSRFFTGDQYAVDAFWSDEAVAR